MHSYVVLYVCYICSYVPCKHVVLCVCCFAIYIASVNCIVARYLSYIVYMLCSSSKEGRLCRLLG